MAPNKPSRTPRSGKSGQPNFKRMKRRLQLKVKDDKPGVHQDQEVLDEEPLASVPPEIDGDHCMNEDDDHHSADEDDVHHPADEVGDEGHPAADRDDEVLGKAKPLINKKNQSKFFNRASPMKIMKVCKDMNEDQRKLIISADFGDMLKMKCSKLNPELCRFLMECFNPKTCELEFGERGKIPVTAQSVFKVLGVPMGSSPVPYHLDVDATSLILNMFDIHGGGQPEITLVAKELGPTYPADQNYLRKFIIYLQSSVFAPTTGTKVSPKCYPSVINTKAINKLNWAKFIVDQLVETANAKDKKNWFKACMPYLMILYVDSLETDVIDVPEDGTRCTIWTNKMIKLIVDLDTRSNGSFGKLPLKACFRNTFSLFSSNPTIVDMFIRTHVPDIHDEEALAKYRVPVIDMCRVFEDGLGKFLISLTDKETKASTNDQGKEDVEQNKEIPKHRRVRRRAHQVVRQGNAKEKTSDEATETAVPESKSKKLKPMNQEILRGRGQKKMMAESEGEAAHFATSHDNDSDLQRMGELKVEPNCQCPATSLANDITAVDGLAEPHGHDGSATQISTQDGEEQCCAETAKCPTPVSTCNLRSVMDPLKLLQCYGTGSQSPTTNQSLNVTEEQLQGGSRYGTQLTMKSSGNSKKSVSFAQQVDDPLVHSNLRKEEQQVKDVFIKTSPAPRRSPRFANAETNAVTESTNFALAPVDDAPLISSHQEENNNTNRKLDMEFRSPEQTKTKEERNRQELIEPEGGKFDLGFDHPKLGVRAETAQGMELKDEVVAEIVIVSSDEDSGDSLDEIYANIDIPTSTTVSEHAHVAEEINVPSDGSKSYTPIPKAHKTRLVKPSKAQKSPYMDNDKKTVSNKFTNEIYDRVCEYGGDTEDKINKLRIVDYDKYFIYLYDLADSVRPKAWLSNSTCEVALHVLSVEMAHQRKHVMPLRLSTKLRSAVCIHDRLVKKMFKVTPQCRLDHSDQVMFPVLQDLTPELKEFNGHYYLIVLNLRAERFEVMDSLRGKRSKGLLEDSRAIIGSIKHLWEMNYGDSKINIQNCRTEHIDTPMQKTSYDCGFFMLKFTELWNGRMMGPLNPTDMPNIRKFFLKKWLEFEEKKDYMPRIPVLIVSIECNRYILFFFRTKFVFLNHVFTFILSQLPSGI